MGYAFGITYGVVAAGLVIAHWINAGKVTSLRGLTRGIGVFSLLAAIIVTGVVAAVRALFI